MMRQAAAANRTQLESGSALVADIPLLPSSSVSTSATALLLSNVRESRRIR